MAVALTTGLLSMSWNLSNGTTARRSFPAHADGHYSPWVAKSAQSTIVAVAVVVYRFSRLQLLRSIYG